MSDSQLAYLDELVARDQLASVALTELDELLAAVATTRVRAEVVRCELAEGPGEIEQRNTELAVAHEELEAASARLEQALGEERAARDDDDPGRTRSAEHQIVIERDSIGSAEKRVADAETRLATRRAQLSAARAEEPVVEQRAGELAQALEQRPRLPASVATSPTGLAGVCEWCLEARAALFVARAAVAGEREQAIRQAGELGAMITGDTVPTSSMETIAAVIRDAVAP